MGPPWSARESEGVPVKRNAKQLLPMIFVFSAVAAAYAFRIFAMFDIGGEYFSYARAAIYLLLFALWGGSIDRRIIQKQALHCLRMTAALMLFWLILRTLKYEVITDQTAARYVWYLYYLPMLFIPLFGVFIALSLGKPEEQRMIGKAGILAVVPAVLFLLIITNDLHQMVFAFKDGVPTLPQSGKYFHRLLYFVCFGWIIVSMTFLLICLFRKSRIPGSKKKRLIPFLWAA